MPKRHMKLPARIWALCLGMLAATPALNGPVERIYLANDDHTDYFWTAGEATYRDAFIRMIDYYIARADATETKPSHEQARFTDRASRSSIRAVRESARGPG